ncbi:DUF6506 family protein [Chitinilyticum aquatile]|uniref:DUF6506 family protein n=1 Tax=Chitinilyticum aquatile TaxID=362520 RepID=UPI0004149582|nr:DUF6506 family protein [Chitinilyticum aquatile]
MSLRFAFMFVVPEADPSLHRGLVSTPLAEMITIAVPDYAQACRTAVALADEGCVAIELCGGFGHRGVAMVTEAVAGRAQIGVVRFDHHPVLGRSGDADA